MENADKTGHLSDAHGLSESEKNINFLNANVCSFKHSSKGVSRVETQAQWEIKSKVFHLLSGL